ncbi:conserved hypothetical protein [Afipia carboxidovorans OM5]|uniref:Uncharacterized protein n=1 Tax=Afipia carboxidovorans (strain ATCC 49405 / DSM 1227 / KCTC 32145 / OM5) TaxID=504832 RepID=B6JCH0_AFIC5|nr:hypothetical protein [Afipia carboxidovorans]ACI91550.1 conserved hypothetical protein [Afipia carboxidovorans OM5]AEI01285.1 hypothetical protein OCA4_c01270 [Afipia carboxidovorans OM4]AEI04859.1 hypothetical protein OCA5_c01270 [Afipia carboxidovorans OM5]
MLHFRMLASSIPLLAVGILAGGQFTTASQPCIAVGHTSVQIATAPWQPQQHVSFTDDASRATVRVQLVDSPEMADFTVVDDVDASPDAAPTRQGCPVTAAMHYVAIAEHQKASEPIIYLSEQPGDYRLYVNSTKVSVRDAAALLIGAAPQPGQLVLSQL